MQIDTYGKGGFGMRHRTAMMAKRKPQQSDLFRRPEEPEDVERALAEENELRNYARRILAERKAKRERDDGE